MATIDDLRKGLDLLYDRFADGDEAVAVLGLLAEAVAELSAARARVALLEAAAAAAREVVEAWGTRAWCRPDFEERIAALGMALAGAGDTGGWGEGR